jgi:hypothetical protein
MRIRDLNGQDWPHPLRMDYLLAKIDDVQQLALPDNGNYLVAENHRHDLCSPSDQWQHGAEPFVCKSGI